MVTIKDVAREAGVAISTVSYALNDSAPVKAETRERILKAVEELGYRPSTIARGLATRRTNAIGLIIPRPAGKAFSDQVLLDLLRGIGDAANGQGYNILLAFENSKDSEHDYWSIYRTKAVDGILFMSPKVNETRYYELVDRKFPFVLLGRSLERQDMNVVDIDNVVGGYQATEHLIVLGHTKIGFISPGPLSYLLSADRLQGYKQALEDYELPYNEELVAVGSFTQESGYSAMQELLQRDVQLSAVFVGDDLLALGAMEAIRAAGLRIPEDVAVLGFNDSLAARIANPSLTSVRVPTYETGFQGTEILIRNIRYPKTKPKNVVLRTDLVVRQSCGSNRKGERRS